MRGKKSRDDNWLFGYPFTLGPVFHALRSLKDPGKANDDDNNISHMNQFDSSKNSKGRYHTHKNSGIGNRAFYNAAIALDGYSWEKAGQIWYSALNDKKLKSDSGFQDFASLTYQHACSKYGMNSYESRKISEAWKNVGITVNYWFPMDPKDQSPEKLHANVQHDQPSQGSTTAKSLEDQHDQSWVSSDGIAGYDLKSLDDKIFAFDYDKTRKLDHLVLYRPGSGKLWIIKHNLGSFSMVFRSENGIGGYDLKSPNQRIFAFDYTGEKRLDHLMVYHPGAGTFAIFKNSEGTFSSVCAGTGFGPDFDLTSPYDRIFAFDYEHSGNLDHLVAYSPCAATYVIVKNTKGVLSYVYSGIGIGGYGLSSPKDATFPFDFESSGKQDYIVVYRYGTDRSF